MEKQLFWHNAAGDPLRPFENNGMIEIESLVDTEIRDIKWDLCRVTNRLTLKVIGRFGSTRFYLDWFTG